MSLTDPSSAVGPPDPSTPLRVVLRGGLGSQLFSVYAGYQLATESRRPLEWDVTRLEPDLVEHDVGVMYLSLPGTFVVDGGTSTWRRLRSLKRRLIGDATVLTPWLSRASQLAASRGRTETNTNALSLTELSQLAHAPQLDGFYLSWEIAHAARASGLTDVIRPSHISRKAQEIDRRIRSEGLGVVHVRRGDYVSLKERFGLLAEEYYLAAYEHLQLHRGPAQLLCFSDDPPAAARVLQASRVPFTLADPHLELNSAETLWVMSQARAHVVSNSTLSWHAAFWSSQTSIIVCPEPLYIDPSIQHSLYAPTWIRVPSHLGSMGPYP